MARWLEKERLKFMQKPLVLLSNDDGYDAPGLVAMRTALQSFARVVVCAPAQDQSAVSHALTLREPVRLRQHEEDVFSLTGTPADTVYLALHGETMVLPRIPDLVVSGINHGPNLGRDVIYSGTVAAAREAVLKGVRALAVSASTETDLLAAAAFAGEVAREILADNPEAAQLFNLNIPAGDTWELRSCLAGHRHYDHGVVVHQDPRGRDYLWIGGSNIRHGRDAGTDTCAWAEGAASLTLLTTTPSDKKLLPVCQQLVARVTAEP
jgi:5'-nucleotidase